MEPLNALHHQALVGKEDWAAMGSNVFLSPVVTYQVKAKYICPFENVDFFAEKLKNQQMILSQT